MVEVFHYIKLLELEIARVDHLGKIAAERAKLRDEEGQGDARRRQSTRDGKSFTMGDRSI